MLLKWLDYHPENVFFVACLSFGQVITLLNVKLENSSIVEFVLVEDVNLKVSLISKSNNGKALKRGFLGLSDY